MKGGSVLAIFLGTALLAGVASASPKPSEDIQAPRIGDEVIQAPRIGDEDIQAPRSGNEDIESPRGQQPPPAPKEATRPPRGGAPAGRARLLLARLARPREMRGIRGPLMAWMDA